MMRHTIEHRFNKTFIVSTSTTCDLCQRPMLFYGKKCKDCKYMCHGDCAELVPPSCGLPNEYVHIFAQTIASDDSRESWPRQNSLTAREWDIAFDDLKNRVEIGTGTFRFGKVYKGDWHGDVAIKCVEMSNNVLEDSLMLQRFKEEVATFRKTRHDNLVLFMGACMKPRHLAIITSYCKGDTLYTHLHVNRNRFNLQLNISIAQQICHGMGYLHARGIVHKDLKTKNVFYEPKGKVVITDFGLFSLKKLSRSSSKNNDGCLIIPRGWLCYLAPELMRSFAVRKDDEECNSFELLPFANATDIYAFGTIWYELLSGEQPHCDRSAEAAIWQIGSGLKPPLTNVLASKELKDIILFCWSGSPESRPDFPNIHTMLERLPRKRMQRLPSL